MTGASANALIPSWGGRLNLLDSKCHILCMGHSSGLSPYVGDWSLYLGVMDSRGMMMRAFEFCPERTVSRNHPS